MKNVYIEDDLSNQGHATFFFFPDANTIITGTKWLAMDTGERNHAYDEIEKSHGIRFIYRDNLPTLPFYSIPLVHLFAEVVSGGYLGRFPAVDTISEAVCYFNDWKCYLVADNTKSFLANPLWKEQMTECPLIKVFHSREHASQYVEILLASTLQKSLLPGQKEDN